MVIKINNLKLEIILKIPHNRRLFSFLEWINVYEFYDEYEF